MSTAVTKYLSNLLFAKSEGLENPSGSPANSDHGKVNLPDAFQYLPDCVSLHTHDGRILAISDNAAKILKSDAISLSGRGFIDEAQVQDQVAVLKAISDCQNEAHETTVTFRKLNKNTANGEVSVNVFEMRCSPYAMESESGDADYVLAITRDVSDQQELISATEQKLARAENANDLKSTFFSTVSHELRTPLNAIIGFSQMLQGAGNFEITGEKTIEYAGLIHSSADHLLSVVNDILDASKIEVGKYEICPEAIDLNQVLNSTINMIKPVAESAGVIIDPEIDDQLPMISADPRSVRQIVFNLLGNAIKFSTAGERIRVGAVRKGTRILLEVEDTGIGMDAKTINQLGTKFFQAEQGKNRNYEGAGLGLSIVFGLVELHGGEVSINSAKEQGTCVSITLPVTATGTRPVPADAGAEIVYLGTHEREEDAPPLNLAQY